MRDPSRSFAPCGEFLRLNELGQILERHDPPPVALGALEPRDRDLQIAELASADQGELARASFRRPVIEVLAQHGELGWKRGIEMRQGRRLLDLKHPESGLVDAEQSKIVAECEDSRRHALEDRGQICAFFVDAAIRILQLDVRLSERIALGLELGSHAIERIDQYAEFISSFYGDAVVVVASRKRLRPFRQRLHGNGDSAGDENRYPEHAEQNRERDREKQRGLRCLQSCAL